MNNALKEIACKYEVSEEEIPAILAGMKVKDAQKPSKPQLEGFEKVCRMLKEGQPMDQALATILEEAKNDKTQKDTQVNGSTNPSESLQTESSEAKLEEFILSLANQSADATFASLPNIALEEHHRLKALFVQQYRQRIMERLQDPEFRQQFQAAIEGQDMGKLPLLNSTTSNIALLSSSSSSS